MSSARSALHRVGGARGGWLDIGRRVWDEMWKDEVFDRAAALSYYLLFALFPALLFLTALVGLLPWDIMDQLMEQLDRALPSDIVQKTFAEITDGAGKGIVSLGVVLAFWAASSGMAAVMSALSAVYGVRDRRSWWQQRLVALGATLALALFTPAALLLLLFGEELGSAAAGWLGMGPLFELVWTLVRWPLTVTLAGIGVGLLFRLAPAAQVRRRWLSPGAFFAVAAWLAMSIGLKLYVAQVGSYSVTYGSIAGVILTLLWLYLSGLALLIGAELDAELGRAPAPPARTP